MYSVNGQLLHCQLTNHHVFCSFKSCLKYAMARPIHRGVHILGDCVYTYISCTFKTATLFAIWPCQSQAWRKKEGKANNLGFDTVKQQNFIKSLRRSDMHDHILDLARIHSFIQAISIAPLQVHYYSEAPVADPGHLVRGGRFIYFTFSEATSGNSYE